MRVVLDTNIWVSMFTGKVLAQLVPFIEEDRIQPVISKRQLIEIVNTVTSPKLGKYFTLEVTTRLLTLIQKAAIITGIKGLVLGCRDPKDDFILESALSGHADIIITGDKDLLSMHPFRNILILSYRDFEKFLLL